MSPRMRFASMFVLSKKSCAERCHRDRQLQRGCDGSFQASCHVRASSRGEKAKTVDLFLAACESVFALLERSDLSESEKNMIQQVAPAALKEAGVGRHKFQQNVVDLLAEQVKSVEAIETDKIRTAAVNV